MQARNGKGKASFAAVAGLVVGLASGTWIGSTWLAAATPSMAASTIAPVLDGAEHGVFGEGVRLASPERSRIDPPHQDSSATGAEPVCPLYGETQRSHGEQGIRDGWKLERKDEPNEAEMKSGLVTYEGFVRDSPRSIGRQLGAKRNAAEAALADAQRGGLFALLAKLNAGNVGPLVDEVRDDSKLAKYFQRSWSTSSIVDGSAHKHPDKELEDGATLSFPAGVYLLANLMEDKNPFPRDITVTGAGMDATMLVLDGSLDTRGELVNFTVRDCTMHSNGNPSFGLRRGNPAALTCERVRFVGFDRGSGGSALFNAGQFAVRCVDCQILGGYGNAPQFCSLFDVRTDALLARFERCRIEQVQLHVDQWRPGATLVFVGCALTDLIDAQPIESFNHAGVVLDGCSVTYLPNGWQSVVKKDLNDLFPSWQQRLVR